MWFEIIYFFSIHFWQSNIKNDWLKFLTFSILCFVVAVSGFSLIIYKIDLSVQITLHQDNRIKLAVHLKN
ncbi:hypothetical protein C1638_006855 [Chryseobacterium oncorhynchi]|uniref:Uncharacterized protein n=1 Tax=Chryseobacterium oncorhynchi TaxID=741074 RepID=A0A316WX16_9FLAO|nr:hypothetical protein C1638_006855 [Chryseobacterium oncorhynchi]